MDVHAVGGPPDGPAQGFHGSEFTHSPGSEVPHSCFHPLRTTTIHHRGLWQTKGGGADLIFDLDGDHLHGISYTDFLHLCIPSKNKHGHYGTTTWSRVWLQRNTHNSRSLVTAGSTYTSGTSLFHFDTNARREIVTYIRGVGLKYPRPRPTIRGGRDVWTKASKEYRICFRRHRRKNQVPHCKV